MLIAIFGENCTGKSAVANELRIRLDAKVYTGKDYVRLDKNETQAKAKFRRTLEDAVHSEIHTVYVISEPEQLSLLPNGCVRVLVTAELETIHARFAKRMGGSLPAPVAAMLERRHGLFDREVYDVHVVSGEKTVDEVCTGIISFIAARRIK